MTDCAVEFFRDRVVRKLRVADEQWRKNVAEKRVTELNRIVDELLAFDVAPREFAAVSGLGLTFRVKTLSKIIDAPELCSKIARLRARWMTIIDCETHFYSIFSEILALHETFKCSVCITCCRIMLELGFRSIRELESAKFITFECLCGPAADCLHFLRDFANERAEITMREIAVQAILDLVSQPHDEQIIGAGSLGEYKGPADAIKRSDISSWTVCEKRKRLDNAWVNVGLASAPGSRKTYLSAVRCYLYFWLSLKEYGPPVPVKSELVVLWSCYFRNVGTFCTYLAALRWISDICNVDSSALDCPLVRRAKTSLRNITKPRTKTWIRSFTVCALFNKAMEQSNARAAMWMACAYAFLSRVPSELLCAVYAGDKLTSCTDCGNEQATLQFNGQELRLHLRKRKNLKQPSSII